MVNRTYWDSFDCEQQCEENIDEYLEETFGEEEAAEEGKTAAYFYCQTTTSAYKAPASCKGEQG